MILLDLKDLFKILILKKQVILLIIAVEALKLIIKIMMIIQIKINIINRKIRILKMIY